MQYYPRVTNISTNTTFRRQRLLPYPGEVVVRAGQQVTPVQVVARSAEERGFLLLRASQTLGVSAEEVAKYLLVEEGAAVQRGQPLMAKKQGLFGKAKEYKSPVDGVVHRVLNGRLLLRQTPTIMELRAMVRGRVASVVPRRGVVLEITGSVIQGVWGSGQESTGILRLAVPSAGIPLTRDFISAESRRSILVAGTVKGVDVLREAEHSGVRGLVVGSMPADLCTLAVETVSFPILVLEGMGTQPLNEDVFELLQEYDGLEVSLLGKMDGNERPELIVPGNSFNDELGSEQVGFIEVGHRVRISRTPYLGMIGDVKRVYRRRKTTTIGVLALGVDVQLLDGDVVFIPYDNLELVK